MNDRLDNVAITFWWVSLLLCGALFVGLFVYGYFYKPHTGQCTDVLRCVDRGVAREICDELFPLCELGEP